jgi:hypothetical protein
MSSGEKSLLCHVMSADVGSTCLYSECDSTCSSSLSLDTIYTAQSKINLLLSSSTKENKLHLLLYNSTVNFSYKEVKGNRSINLQYLARYSYYLFLLYND